MELKVKLLHPSAKVPTRSHPTDVGLDVYIAEISPITTQTGCLFDEKIDFGIAVEPPPGFYVELVSRSSIYKSGCYMTNGVGVIDPSYRGSISMIVAASSTGSRHNYNVGDRFGQLVLRKAHYVEVVVVKELSDTSRGTGGFGSTGTS